MVTVSEVNNIVAYYFFLHLRGTSDLPFHQELDVQPDPVKYPLYHTSQNINWRAENQGLTHKLMLA